MNIISINIEQASEFFKKHPSLILMGFSDELVKEFQETGVVSIADQYFLGLELEGRLEGVWTFSCFTPEVLICHGYINPKYHHKGISFQLQTCVMDYIKKTAPMIKNIMMMVPEHCAHIVKMAKLHSFKEAGVIPNGIMWRGKLNKLYLYTKEVK